MEQTEISITSNSFWLNKDSTNPEKRYRNVNSNLPSNAEVVIIGIGKKKCLLFYYSVFV